MSDKKTLSDDDIKNINKIAEIFSIVTITPEMEKHHEECLIILKTEAENNNWDITDEVIIAIVSAYIGAISALRQEYLIEVSTEIFKRGCLNTLDAYKKDSAGILASIK